MTHECVCVPCTTDESAPLCDNNDVTHENKCKYNYYVCHAQEEIGIKHYGACKRESFLLFVPEFLAVNYQERKIDREIVTGTVAGSLDLSSLAAITLLVN